MTTGTGIETGDLSRVRGHHAFISYHKASSATAARVLQSQLEAIARRSRIGTRLDLFRDDTSLVLGHLDQTLERELRASRRLIVLLHSETRRSEWVDKEVRYWLASGGSPDRLVLARIDPSLDLSWDPAANRFAHERALPASLCDAFPHEPLWIDLHRRWHGRFADERGQVSRLCATLVERDPAEILQRELRAQRRRQLLLAGTSAVLGVLLVVAVVASVVATRSRDLARQREAEAIAQAQAAESLLLSAERPERSVELLIEASARSADRSVRSAMLAVLQANDRLSAVLPMPASFGGFAPDDLVFSPSGRRLAGWRQDHGTAGGVTFALWDVDGTSVLAEGTVAGGAVGQVQFFGENDLVYCGDEGVETVSFGDSGPVHATAVGGADACSVGALSGGAFGVARSAGGSAEAVLLGHGGERTVVGDVRWLLGAPRGEIAVLQTADSEVKALHADGRRVIELDGLAGSHIDDVLWLDGRGTIIVRTRDGSIVRSAALEPDPSARPLDVPAGVLAVAEVRGAGATGHLWLTADEQLQWSFGPGSIDLGDLRDDTPMDLSVPPAIWVSERLTLAAVAFASNAALVSLDVASGEPSMTLTDTLAVGAWWAGRTSLLSPYEWGRHAAILPTGANSVAIVRASGQVERADGIAFFDPSGNTAVVFGDTPLRLLTAGEFDAVEDLSASRDVAAAALSPTGDLLAVVRPASPVTLYETRPRAELPSLVADATEPWRGHAAFGRRTFRAAADGQISVQVDGADSGRIEGFGERLVGLHVMRPDGLAAVVETRSSPLAAAEEEPLVVEASGTIEPVPPPCAVEDPVFRFLPGASFRSSVEAAELQELAVVGTDGRAVGCAVGDETPPLMAPEDLFDYQMDGSSGRIVARRPDGQIDVTTWRRPDGVLEQSVLPGSGADTAAAVDVGGDVAAVWTPGAGTISVLRAAGGSWTAGTVVETSIGDTAAVLPDATRHILVVVGATGTIEVFDLDTAQLLLRRELELLLPGLQGGATVRWVSTERTGDDYTLHLGVGQSAGAVREGLRVTFPLDAAALRDRLCALHPSAPACALESATAPDG